MTWCERCSGPRTGGSGRLGRQWIPPGHHSTPHAAVLAGITHRQLDYWVRTGRLAPAWVRHGSGSSLAWSEEDVKHLRVIAARLDWGMTLDAALRAEDPPVPNPVSRRAVGALVTWVKDSDDGGAG